MKRTTKYITHNLNEATYLAMKGLKYKSRCTGAVSSVFSFEHDSLTERYRREFWTKGCRIDIHSWIALRTAIKDELRGQIKHNETENNNVLGQVTPSKGGVYHKPDSFQPKNGEKYWITVAGNAVANLYGDKDIHKNRADAGMCYHTRDEALLADKLK